MWHKWDSVTPYLERAHFLPIKQRIKFKIALTAFKCLNNIAPSYLKQCLQIKDQPLKTLRTDLDYFLLKRPSVPNLVRTERGFSFCGPSIWNNLPYSVRTCNNILQFKKLLKTHLFREAFEVKWDPMNKFWIFQLNDPCKFYVVQSLLFKLWYLCLLT